MTSSSADPRIRRYLALPEILRNARRWVGSIRKAPIDLRRPPSGASTTDPSTWTDFGTAGQAVERGLVEGIGFVFGPPFVGVDLDHVRDPETGAIDPSAREIIAAVNSYTEISASGTGIHIIATGTLPPGRRRTSGVEMYAEARHFVMTGDHLDRTPRTVEERTTQLATLHAETFGRPDETPAPIVREPSRSVATISDDDLVLLASAAANGLKFARLFAGDASDYGSRSEADLALVSLLAFWTQRDAERIDRLFRKSGLFREKWNRRDYRERTLARAIASTSEVYDPPVELALDLLAGLAITPADLLNPPSLPPGLDLDEDDLLTAYAEDRRS